LHRFPKGACQAELNKHRTISNNSFSSRAVNKNKYIDMIISDPYIPIWTYDKPGMSGEVITDETLVKELTSKYIKKMYSDIECIKNNFDGVHKQDTNAQLDHYARIPIIVTSTNFPYYFELRTAAGVKPEFRRIALLMQQLFCESTPKLTSWHIPWLTQDEDDMDLNDKLIMCAARCAWLSYSNHLKQSSLDSAKKLVDKLIKEMHSSVFDHAAKSSPNRVGGIYKGWMEHRKILMGE
jgi:hypothetical protein